MKSLFDLSFNRYIAPTVAKIVYILAMVIIALGYLIFVISSFRANAFLGVVVLLILGPLVGLLYLVFIRIGLESLLASIKTAQNTAELVRLAGGSLPPEGSATSSAYGQGPSQPYAGYPASPPAP
ncbi:DUF4282 domain-containing protein [Arthrobacter sp. H14-L1]|uniref:DUF4282 domain-containing protein n=1 Tax=Arthrobacter sp. H14-L1 TaxID=2996697 RepID=UPI00226F30D0|nr:DUF4282 domain-containing protein [Arthrobacter sp. H14-L1]MCY0904640.1 DUF4282 domain-containing protein [Arthrobacter sp. H14-L1]